MEHRQWSLIAAVLLLFVGKCVLYEWKTPSWATTSFPSPTTQRQQNYICQTIDSQLLNSTSHELLVHGYNGGLGHKFISLFYSLTYALLTGRRFQGTSHSRFFHLVNLPIPVWNVTDNCLTPYRFNDLKSVLRGVRFTYRKHTMLDLRRCSLFPDNETLESIFGDREIVLNDCRLSLKILNAPRYLDRLRQLGLMGPDDSFEDYQKRMMRMLMKPNPELSRVISHFQETHFANRKVVGVQVRMGGCLANTQEFQEMMSVEELKQLPLFIRREIRIMGYQPGKTVLFLSTDSTIADNYLKEQLGNEFPIVEQNVFSRNHTKGFAKSEPTMGALMDIWLLANSDGLITCKGSGFGRVASMLSHSYRKVEYPVTHQPAVQFNRTKRRCYGVVGLWCVCLEMVLLVLDCRVTMGLGWTRTTHW